MTLLGRSMQFFLNKYKGWMTKKTVLMFATQAFKILQGIHASGFLHRDIKPSNILVGEPDSSKIYFIDFGSSKSYINK